MKSLGTSDHRSNNLYSKTQLAFLWNFSEIKIFGLMFSMEIFRASSFQ